MDQVIKRYTGNIEKAADGTIRVMMTTDTQDRHGEVVDPNGLDPVPTDVPMLLQHDSFQLALGTFRKIQREVRGWSAEPYFDPDDEMAMRVKSKVDKGILKTVSIGFIGKEAKDINGIYTFTKWELIECSWVTIPANPDAQVMKVKSLTDKQLESINDFFKTGAVLSQKNKQNLEQAKEKIETVLTEAEKGFNTDAIKNLIDDIIEAKLKDYSKPNESEVIEILNNAYQEIELQKQLKTLYNKYGV